MKHNFKKIGLLFAFLSAILFVTACTPQENAGDNNKNTYTVTYYISESAEAKTLTLEEGDTLASAGITSPTLEGYDFDGWYTADGKKITESTPVTSDLTIYAKYSKIVSEDDNSKTTETVSADGSTATITTTTTEDDAGTITTTTTTTTTDKDGKITTEETEVSVDAEGNTRTKTTDAEGNTSTEVETPKETTVHDLILLGLKALESNADIATAQAYFDAAYKKDSNDDEAKVYSALSDIASIVTNKGIKQFFSDHLGITNYPSDLSSLVAGDWLSYTDYPSPDTTEYNYWSLNEEENPNANTLYWYKAKEVSEISDFYKYNAKYKVTIDSNECYVDDYTKARYEVEKKGVTKTMFSSYRFYYSSRGHYYVLDEDGDCLIEINSDLAGDAKAYTIKYGSSSYEYTVITKAPSFKLLEDESWFTVQASNAMYVQLLLVANIINGNSEAFDTIIDDLYSSIFESDEYKSACNKIEAISAPVALPAEAVAGLSLDEIFGEGEVKIGATELKLIKTVLDIYKGIFEYVQSYKIGLNLSFLKKDFEKFISLSGPEDIKEYVMSLISSYNKDIDPIANGFLEVRSEEKMTAAKNTFVGVLTDLITSYDSITGEDSIYPGVKEMVSSYALLREAASALKDAISNGGIFYIPKEFDSSLEKWPLEMSDSVYFIDCSKLFLAGEFAFSNLIELDDIGIDNAKAPVFYEATLDKTTGVVTLGDVVKTGEKFLDIMMNGGLLAVKLNCFNVVSEVTNFVDVSQFGDGTFPVSPSIALLFFNFYYGGLDEVIAQMAEASEAESSGSGD